MSYRAHLLVCLFLGGAAARCSTDSSFGEVLIPAGSFEMGSNIGPDNEKPVHTVQLPSFYMDETEVTVEQYRECVSEGECEQAVAGVLGSSDDSYNWDRPGRESHPINGVSWVEARAFCAWAGKRLPTEEEWEYAARGSDGREYPWGNDAPSGVRLNTCDSSCPLKTTARDFSTRDDGWPKTAPVGSYPSDKSPFGLYDMAGNLAEWTVTHLCDYDGGSCLGNPFVVRGGHWLTELASSVRASHRGSATGSPEAWVGFRCARSN